MSYDLMVFDPKIAPRDHDEFMTWYRDLTQWKEDRDYNFPEGMTGNLANFYNALREEFPPMNGPYAYNFDTPTTPLFEPRKSTFLERLFGRQKQKEDNPQEFNEAMITDYSLATNAIYMAFAWSVAEQAYNRVFNVALSTGVGFFNVSANEGDILHDAKQFEDLMGL